MSTDPALEEVDLTMKNTREDCPHPPLPHYDMALKESNESYKANQYPVALERHHIIPCHELIAFWNNVCERKLTRYLEKLFKAMQNISKNVYPVGALLRFSCEQ